MTLDEFLPPKSDLTIIIDMIRNPHTQYKTLSYCPPDDCMMHDFWLRVWQLGSGVPDDYEFTLEALEPFTSEPAGFKIGSVIPYRATIHASNVQKDIQVHKALCYQGKHSWLQSLHYIVSACVREYIVNPKSLNVRLMQIILGGGDDC